ncbi:hypothetical protein LF844_09735 [Metapseudomonas lalkuanensis]|uniref:DUF1281 family ferredoxin-like fold protein n=1 Tax=Metapseudomonas lalkuanensis TaxID=2604832 RepID=UPI001CF5F404|nr:hypothetical protein [Pseudomonas lalkuanensis]UCP00070.1 hypothetical protein LF844_09735 [Pseudomonas lalkuanensis]
MPNHVTTEIKATPEVIAWMLNEEGRVDFSKIIPFAGEFPWNGIACDAETLANVVRHKPLDEHPLIASLEAGNRDRTSLDQLSDESFEQFVQMLRNHRATGYLHNMEFAIAKWGTKWNAYDQTVDQEAGTARFDTAWSFPEPILSKVSEQFPDATIEIRYADEDIGSNCGSVTFLGGKAIVRDEVPRWADMSEAEQKKWTAFAYEVKRWQPDPDDE